MTIINSTWTVSNGGTINITPTQDPGSTVDSAYDLGVFHFDNGTVAVEQTVGNNDSADVYQFTIDEAGEYSFALDGLDANADLFLLAENNESSDNPYGDFEERWWYDVSVDYSDYIDYFDWGDGYWDIPYLSPIDLPEIDGHDEGELDLDLPYDSALAYSTSLGSEAELINIELNPGTYHVGVYAADTLLDSTSYNLTLSDNVATTDDNPNLNSSNLVPEQDPGNDVSSAYDLGIIETNLTIAETVGSRDITDVYQLTIDRSGYYDVSLDELNADADLVLIDSSYQTIGVSQNYDFASESIFADLDTGTYYVGVYSYDGIETNYELTIADAII